MHIETDQPGGITREAITKPVDADPPLVDVIMIDTRGAIKPDWVNWAKDSVRNQTHPNVGLIVVDNREHGRTIGKAWNDAVRASSAPLVMPLGDDDALHFDAVATHVATWKAIQQLGRNFHAVTSLCMACDERLRPIQPMMINHTGMYDRAWLLENPFNEFKPKEVDTEMHARLKAHDIERSQLYNMRHYSGYYYRQHPWQVSGQKLVITRKGQPIVRGPQRN